MKTIPATELRKDISKVLDMVTHKNRVVGVGRRNKIEALIIKYPEHRNDDMDDVTNFNANSSSFDFLRDEPDTYSIADLKKRYV
jgi:hypothetical protein